MGADDEADILSSPLREVDGFLDSIKIQDGADRQLPMHDQGELRALS